MPSDYDVRRGDTAYAVEYTLPCLPTGKSLATASVHFRYGLMGGDSYYIVTGSVLDADAHTVMAECAPAEAGTYNTEFVITWADLTTSIYPREDYLVLEVGAPLLPATSPADVQIGTAPASPTATGVAGQMVADSGFLYVCVATDTWIRFAADDTWV